ncbi:helix-turn-helix domain-containing protein [Brevibacillus sp. TJ4]|uniref:helix-turn-helix domain-containing protein n=1 Tax=Brevibacillus sp. TJ4 TaxID=3234853 RepID=UPI0037D4580E
MSIRDQLLLWNHAALHVLDVRHTELRSGEVLGGDRLSDSVFMLASQGKATITIDATAYEAAPCWIVHAGAGATVETVRVWEEFACTIVTYRMVLAAATPLPAGLPQSIARLQRTYSFLPRYPLSLLQKMEQMHQGWQDRDELARFHVQALFHQFLYELVKQMREEGSERTRPTLVGHAVQYIEEHYAEALSLQSLAAMLDCSARQLQRMFRAELNVGPMEYLIQVRLKKAKDLLLLEDAPIAHIAGEVGYADSYYFSRMFKKYVGMSPSQFKEQALQQGPRRQNPSRVSQMYIVSKETLLYSEAVENGFLSHTQNEAAKLAYSDSQAALPVGSEDGGGVADNSKREARKEGGMAVSASRPLPCKQDSRGWRKRPRRIAVLDYQYVDQLWALGEQPVASVVGTSDTGSFLRYVSDELEGVRMIGTKDQPDLQAIVASEPDLIICTQLHVQLYSELAKIAPTLVLDRNEDWRVTLPVLGEIVGKPRQAQKVIDEYNAKIVHLKDALRAKLGRQTVSLIRPRDNAIRLHTTSHRTAKILYRDLGIAAPAMAVDHQRTSSLLPLDAIAALDADRLFVLQDNTNARLTNEYRQTAIWQGLNAVKANHVCTVNTTVWIGYYGPIGNNQVVDQIARALL